MVEYPSMFKELYRAILAVAAFIAALIALSVGFVLFLAGPIGWITIAVLGLLGYLLVRTDWSTGGGEVGKRNCPDCGARNSEVNDECYYCERRL